MPVCLSGPGCYLSGRTKVLQIRKQHLHATELLFTGTLNHNTTTTIIASQKEVALIVYQVCVKGVQTSNVLHRYNWEITTESSSVTYASWPNDLTSYFNTEA